MKVLLKSLKELKEEYGIEKIINDYIVCNEIIYSNMLYLLGKILEAKYNKKFNFYIINGWYFHPNLIKGEVINEETIYTIKRLNDGIEYTLSL